MITVAGGRQRTRPEVTWQATPFGVVNQIEQGKWLNRVVGGTTNLKFRNYGTNGSQFDRSGSRPMRKSNAWNRSELVA
jgi:hypothetical protein